MTMTGIGTGAATGINESPQLLPLCELGDIGSIRPLGSASTLSSISSKASVKQPRANSLNMATGVTANGGHNRTDGSAGDCQALVSHSPAPSHSSPTMLNQQPSALSSSSSSSDSGVRTTHYLYYNFFFHHLID